VAHLRENVAGAALELPADAIAKLDAIGRGDVGIPADAS
jgi:aryl-alcohol dehydrogenase-like predicted oxidoreductase